MTYTGITYKDPEYRILEPIVDDDMCSVMMRMRLEKEFSAEELAKKCKRAFQGFAWYLHRGADEDRDLPLPRLRRSRR